MSDEPLKRWHYRVTFDIDVDRAKDFSDLMHTYKLSRDGTYDLKRVDDE